MALYMLLAKKGGVCSIFGDQYCTFITNNTALDGSVTRALAGLRTLSEKMKEHSGIDNPFPSMMERWFGRWKNPVLSMLVSLMVVVAVLVLSGCCCIPYIHSLCVRLISTAMENKSPPYQMSHMKSETKALVGGHVEDSDDERGDECKV